MKNVILVDDNELSLEGIRQNIDWAAMDAQVCATCTNAYEALETLKTHEADLIVSDICMPQMSGLDMTREIVRTKPHIKFIFISAYDDFKYAKEAIRLGICDYVEKPIDYGYLSEVIHKVLKQSREEQEILQQLKRSRPALIQQFLHDLINSSPDYAEYHLKDQANYMNLHIRSEQYICAVIRIDNFMETQSMFGVERYHVLMRSLIQDIEQSFSTNGVCYCGAQGNLVIAIIGRNKDPHRPLARTVYDELFAFQEAYAHSPLSLTIGIGDAAADIWSISSSYQNARQALEYKFLFGEGQVFASQDIRKSSPAPGFLTADAEETLIRLISQKDLAGLKTFTDSMADTWVKDRYDKSGIIAYIHSLLAKLTRFFYDTGVDNEQVHHSIAELLSDVERIGTSAQLCDRLYDILALSCISLRQSVETQHNQIAERVVHYIETHYMNADVGLNDISSSVNVSPSYLGALFKKTKGQNISDLLTEVRLNKAQELLSLTDLKIMEVSEKVGYSNQYYFSACFKKKTGLTPTEFRNKIANLHNYSN